MHVSLGGTPNVAACPTFMSLAQISTKCSRCLAMIWPTNSILDSGRCHLHHPYTISLFYVSNVSRPYGLTLASWSFGTCLHASPSLPPIHHAWASHLTFSIACRLPRRTEHLHIHKPSDMLQNISKITKHNTTPLDSH